MARKKSIADVIAQLKRIATIGGTNTARYRNAANTAARYTNNMMAAPGGTYRYQKRKYARWQTFANVDTKFSRSTYMGLSNG